MKIYIAAMWPPNLLDIKNEVLLSYYDLAISTIPFRNDTFKRIKELKK